LATDERRYSRRKKKTWRARVKIQGVFHHLGYFESKEKAEWHEWKFREQMGQFPPYVHVHALEEEMAPMPANISDNKPSLLTPEKELNLRAASASVI
jgi:hypothetical protein